MLRCWKSKKCRETLGKIVGSVERVVRVLEDVGKGLGCVAEAFQK